MSKELVEAGVQAGKVAKAWGEVSLRLIRIGEGKAGSEGLADAVTGAQRLELEFWAAMDKLAGRAIKEGARHAENTA